MIHVLAVLVVVNCALAAVALSLRFTRPRRALFCLGGRRCADIHIDEAEFEWPEFDAALATVRYECCRCGTVYQISAVIRADGSFTESGRVVVR